MLVVFFLLLISGGVADKELALAIVVVLLLLDVLLDVLLFLKNQMFPLSKPKENPRPVPVWACVSGLWVLVAFLIYWTISHEAWWDGMEEPGEIDVDASLDDFGPTPCTSLKSISTSFQLCGTGLTMFRAR